MCEEVYDTRIAMISDDTTINDDVMASHDILMPANNALPSHKETFFFLVLSFSVVDLFL